jgi:hypothetical protein
MLGLLLSNVAVECLIVCGFRGRWLNGRSALKRLRGR